MESNGIGQQLESSERLKKASVAARNVQRVVARAVRTRYHGTSWSAGCEVLFIAGMISGASALGAGGLVCAGAIGSGLLAMVTCGWFGSLLLYNIANKVKGQRESACMKEFRRSACKLTAATARLPDGAAKQSLRAFSNEAARAFVLGYAATLQGREKWRKKGLRLIEKTATKMRWTDTGAVEAAFCQGQLPKASMLATHLSHEHRKLQEILLHSTRVGQPKP